MIRLRCDCGRQISAPEQWLGKRVKCPQCGRPVMVRAADEAGAMELAAEPAESVVESVVGVASSVSESVIAPSQRAAAPEIGMAPLIDEPVASSEEVPSPAQDEPGDASPGEPVPAVVQASESESESGAKPEVETATPPRPAPSRRPLAPAPPVNAVLQVPIPDEDDRAEYDPRRLPRFIGTMALLIGIAAAALYWSPNGKAWAVPLAGAAVALSAIGFSVGMSRHALGIRIPLLALILSGATLGYLAWTKSHSPAVPSNSSRSSYDPDATREAAKSRGILTVTTLRPAGKIEGPAVDLHFKLTNTSGRAISAVYGSLQLYDDKDHSHEPARLGLNVNQPLAPKAAFEGTNTWTLTDPRIRAALEDNRLGAEYRATTVLYADGSQDDFSQ
ncbi:MAG TPA: hypothetical protein VGI81_16375 [Tepidisphaeraceae bacterium]|jgi:hypothetical protein